MGSCDVYLVLGVGMGGISIIFSLLKLPRDPFITLFIISVIWIKLLDCSDIA